MEPKTDTEVAAEESANTVNGKEVETKTLEQRAALEIINSLKEDQELDNKDANKLVLPLNADELPLDGAKESTLNDYEKIPIAQYGLAMLRGMGFKEDPNKKKIERTADEPMINMVRPKGMGLGADKLIKPKPLLVAPKNGELLVVKKNASVRILSGKYKDLYGQVSFLCLYY